jgi:hypothetical protein
VFHSTLPAAIEIGLRSPVVPEQNQETVAFSCIIDRRWKKRHDRMDTARTVIERAGYRRQRLPGGIWALRLVDSHRETLEAWYEDCVRLMEAWRAGERLRYLHDIRKAGQVTPYAIEYVARVLRRMRQRPVTDARGAILTDNPTLAGLLASFLGGSAYAHWQIRFFEDEEEALFWLSK